jgi:Protein of unknown function (DUF1569)
MKRKPIHLRSLQELLAETTRIEAYAAAGQVRPLGKWTTAQVFQHLSIFVKGSLDGFSFQYPWHIRALSQFVGCISWRWLMKVAFRPGFTNPVVAQTVEPQSSVTLADAAEFLRCQLGRVLGGEVMTQRSPTGEKLSHEQWVECHLRHAELHLRFLEIEPPQKAEQLHALESVAGSVSNGKPSTPAQ